MIEIILEAFFGWIHRPPLLYDIKDWIMLICEIILIILCVSELRKKKHYRFFVSYTYNAGDFDTFEFQTNFKPQTINHINEMAKAIEKQTGRHRVVILYIKQLF